MRSSNILSIFVVVLVVTLAEAGRELHLHSIFEASSREELVDLAGYGEEKLSTVLITGSVVSPDQEASTSPQPVVGFQVRVTCKSDNEGIRKSSYEETFTDEYGDFTLDLPSHLHGTQNLDKVCQVKVLQKGTQRHIKGKFNAMKHKGVIKLVSAHNGVRIYTTGKILLQRVKPEARPSIASTIIRLAKLPMDKLRR